MPRILRIINRLNLGGPTYNAAYLTKYLEPEYDTMLLAGIREKSEESSEHILESLGIRPVLIHGMHRSIHPVKDWLAYREIGNIIRKFRPDIVHTHAAKAGTLGRLSAFAHRVPVVVHTFHGHVFHSYFGPAKTRMYLEIERYLARRSDAIIALSAGQKDELSGPYRVCPPEKIQVVPLGFNLDRFAENTGSKRDSFRTAYGLADDDVAIGIVGRLVPVKNHRMFLRVLRMVLARSGAPVKAFIIGDGEERDGLESYASELHIPFARQEDGLPPVQTARLVFTSWIREMDRAMAGLDVVVLTSFNEGTPVSLIEAQAARRPVVTTRAGGIMDILSPALREYVFDVRDEDLFASALHILANDKPLRERLGVSGAEFAGERFHIRRLVEDMKKLYDNLLARRSR